ncbi:MAG: hypothetical protein OEM32_10320, partial [Acidimicrobiia bacterium]|nr:hypothetical protein [Acidimicrobiia bacterium]
MMEIRRVIGRLASRWLVLVIAGLVGAIGAFVFVQQRNSEVQPVYNAQATVEVPVPVDAGGGDGRGSSNSISDELAVALDIAKTVNQDEVRLPTRFIEAEAETNSLIFVAIEDTELSAI